MSESFIFYKMKEYSKLLHTEKLLTQELQNISSRLQLPGLSSPTSSLSCKLKNDLLHIKELLKTGNIKIIKEKIHEFEWKLSQEKLFLTSNCQDNSLELHDLSAQVEKLAEIIKNHSNSSHVYQLPVKKEYTTKTIKEEEDYLDFIRKTGSTGGWDSVHHSTFISLRGKYSHDLDSFYNVCVAKIPGMLISDIQDHEEWYRNYTRLLQNRKNKIQEWKKSKEIEAEQMIQDLENDQLEKEKLTVDTQRLDKKRFEIKKALQEWKNSKSFNQIKVPVQEKNDSKKELEKRKKIKAKVEAYVVRKNQIQALEKELKAVSLEFEKREKDSRYLLENEKFKKRVK